MTQMDMTVRPELLAATDAEIDDAVLYADPMVLRGLLYQLTGDPELETVGTKRVLAGYMERLAAATDEEAAMLRHKAAEFLKSYRDAGAGPIGIGPLDRLQKSISLMRDQAVPDETFKFYTEEMGLSPWQRALEWSAKPDAERLENFRVVLIGAGMGGLAAAIQLKRAGISYTHLEKDDGVGGTWHENRYPGCRTDSLSRTYTHTFGVDFPYPYAFCPWDHIKKYFDWVADTFDVRDNIQFETEVKSLTWDEASSEWIVRYAAKDGAETVIRANAVMTAVGFLNQPKLPDIEGRDTFQGKAWHTARWPEGADLTGKRVAIIGTGCSGYQLTPVIAPDVAQLSIFQRSPSWVFPTQSYLKPFPPQVNWIDRNLPFYTNFLRLGSGVDASFIDVTTIDPNFRDPHAISAGNKRARDVAVAFLEQKLKDPALVEAMTPDNPPWSARPVAIDPDWSILDAIQLDHVSLITDGIRRITPAGIETVDGVVHEVDIIVYATGFHANEYLFPMTVTGRDGLTTEKLWADEGARAYYGCMIPGFPNLWTLYGPNTNAGLSPATFDEMVTVHALRCIERMILENKSTVEVKMEPYQEYNARVDKENSTRSWSDPRAHSYYWSKFGRSATMNPLGSTELWRVLREPRFEDLEIA